MVMEYVKGGNLFYYQNEHKRFSEERSAIFFYQTLSALEYLHSVDLLHRDLKVFLHLFSLRIFCWIKSSISRSVTLGG